MSTLRVPLSVDALGQQIVATLSSVFEKLDFVLPVVLLQNVQYTVDSRNAFVFINLIKKPLRGGIFFLSRNAISVLCGMILLSNQGWVICAIMCNNNVVFDENLPFSVLKMSLNLYYYKIFA